MHIGSRVGSAALAVVFVVSSCSADGSPAADSTAPVHVPVSLVAGWLPAGFAPQSESLDNTPVDLTDASGTPAATFRPAAGLILSGSNSAAGEGPLVFIAATWADDVPSDYWNLVSHSPLAREVHRGRRDLIVVTNSNGSTLLYFREAGLIVTATAVGLSLADAERVTAELQIVAG